MENCFEIRLNNLRALMKTHGLDGFIVPHGDEFQNEFVPESHQRLKYMTGFTGSAGFAVILQDKAVVMSDGRYTIQLKQQVDQNLYELNDSTKITASKWICENASPSAMIGFDPMLHSKQFIDIALKDFEEKNITLKPIQKNLIDNIWNDRPPMRWGRIEQFPLQYAGISHHDKIKKISEIIKTQNCDAVLLSLPDSVSWCLNLRANDVPHNPILLARLIIFANGTAILLIEKERVSNDLSDYLGANISIKDPQDFDKILGQTVKKIWIDPLRSPIHFLQAAYDAGIDIYEQKDPTIILKAQKNLHEQNAMKSAHVRDGVAIVKFLYWLEQHKSDSDLSELFIADKLEQFRKASPLYKDSSFDTICGWNENGAIIHYRATPESHAQIPANANGILLLDSGAQYEDGTTDITRTISFGAIDPTVRTHNTLVLKGMIAISKAKFPYGTMGAQIDVLARMALWDHGLDYAHGTGHGVGCYLSVHEEATSLSPRGHDKMEVGMIVSNEPGYYKEGSHGIRIENLILCVDTGDKDELDRAILSFDTLTLVPIDQRLIDKNLLDDHEIEWINQYHIRILKEIGPSLTPDEFTWLQGACKAL
jgi:Xaa-Pro aminopeptidase